MKQQGFTLIELIVVIVILGILAVTAAPKFIDITSDAHVATLKGVKAALKAGDQLVYAKAAIAGKQNNASDTVTVNGQSVDIVYGYPSANAGATAGVTAGEGLALYTDIDTTNDWVFTIGSGTGSATEPPAGSFGLSPVGKDIGTGKSVDFTQAVNSCHVVYTQAQDANTPPTVTVVGGNC